MAETFGQQLKRFRRRAGLNIVELAERARVGRKSIRAWEDDKRVPRDQGRLIDLAEALKLSSQEEVRFLAAALAQRNRGATSAPAFSQELAQVSPDLATPLETLPRHLRPVVGDFVGRLEEYHHLLTALSTGQTTIVGLFGMGGMGKTELAYKIANHILDLVPDLQIVLDGHGTRAALPPEQLLRRALAALAPEARLPATLPELEGHYRTLLHGRRALILVDDVRDVVQVRPLIPPQGSVLLLTGRQSFTLPGMVTLDLHELSSAEAITLARTICPRLDEVDAARLVSLCSGLPLAVRTSASLLHNHPAIAVTTYLERLSDERRLAALNDPTDPYLGVETSLMLSYALLDTGAQEVLRRLGVLTGDYGTGMALAVAGAPATDATEEALHLLLRHHLLQYDNQRARWSCHVLVQDLAREQLKHKGDLEATWRRYSDHVVQIALAAQKQFRAGGNGIRHGLVCFDQERHHLDAIWQWAMTTAGTAAGDRLLLTLAAATEAFSTLRNDAAHERFSRLQHVLDAARSLKDYQAEVIALNGLGIAQAELGNLTAAITYFEQALMLARSQSDHYNEGRALNNLGNAYADLGQIHIAVPYFEQRLQLAREQGDRKGERVTLGNLGGAYRAQGHAARALACYERRLELAREQQDLYGEAIALGNLGATLTDNGEGKRAGTYLRKARAMFRTLGDRRGEGLTCANYVRALLASRDVRRAQAVAGYALTLVRSVQDRRLEAYVLGDQGRVLELCNDLAGAEERFVQALEVFEAIQDRAGLTECGWHYGWLLARQGQLERALPLLRARLCYESEIKHCNAERHAQQVQDLVDGLEGTV